MDLEFITTADRELKPQELFLNILNEIRRLDDRVGKMEAQAKEFASPDALMNMAQSFLGGGNGGLAALLK